MAKQIGDVANWAASTVLRRSDLLSVAVDEAIDVYLLTCAKVPFNDLQTTSSELACVVGTQTYSLTSLSPKVSGICSIRMKYSTTSTRRLRRSHARLYDAMGIQSNGKPSLYARWGNSIEFERPSESSLYTYRIRYWTVPTIPDTTDVNEKADVVLETPDEWFELFKWETLYRLYYIDDQPEKAMSLVQPRMLPRERGMGKLRSQEIGIIPRLWNDLLRTVEDREHVDEDFSINPIIREYTS